VRLPTGPLSDALRCPRCKATLAGGADGSAISVKDNKLDSLILNATSINAQQGLLCPICQSQITEGETCITCPTCHQIHHQECWREIGGCGSYGCAHAPAIDKSEQSVQAPLGAWGDTKVCPACRETIKSIALRCRYCGTDFTSVDPLTTADLRLQIIHRKDIEKLKKIVVAHFVLSLFGFLAPLTLIFALAYIYPKRQEVKKCGPLFATMGWMSFGISTVFCALILLFLVSGGLS
jgi:hypothetical protein